MTAQTPDGPGARRGILLRRVLRVGWSFVRQVSGDDAYERYLRHLARFHPDQAPMSRSDHYEFRQEQKWDRPSRCC
jgi:uncharacterized short protein YbdD (DUF466 family)